MRKGGGKQIQWKPLPNFHRYEVSEYGDVRRRFKLKTRAAGSLLKGHIDDDGYRRYTLIDDEGRKHDMVGAHQLVAKLYVSTKPSKKRFQVQHADDDKANNHYSNLKWGTVKQNSADAVKNGCKWIRRFDDSKKSKLNWKAVDDLRKRYIPKRVTCKMLAKEYGVTPALVWLVVTGKTWVK